MGDYSRRKTRSQGDQELLWSQGGFLGGENIDIPTSEVYATELVECYNFIPFRTHLETRPGVKTFAIPNGSGKFNNMFFHKGQRKLVVHRGSELQIYDIIAKTWHTPIASSVTTLSDGLQTTMCEYGDDVAIFSDEQNYVLEINEGNSYYLRLLAPANPDRRTSEVLTYRGPSGSHVYRFLYTLARLDSDGFIIQESGTYVAGFEETDYVEYSMESEYGTNGVAKVNVDEFPNASNQWTHIIVYRTLDLSNVSNNPEAYREITRIGLPAGSGIGTSIIGSTNIVGETANVGGPVNAIGVAVIGVSAIGSSGGNATDDVVSNSRLIETRFFEPLPSGYAGWVVPGYIFCAKRGTKEVNYSATGLGDTKQGYHQPAFQYFELQDRINAIRSSTDICVFLCDGSTQRITTYSSVNEGNAELGEVISVFPAETIAVCDSRIGVVADKTVAELGNGAFVAVCSDMSVRVFDGLNWKNDLAKGKQSRRISSVCDGSVGIADNRGSYVLFYKTFPTLSALGDTLRLGWAEEEGIGWSQYGGPMWPVLTSGCAAQSFRNSDGRMVMVVGDELTSSIVEIEGCEGTANSRNALDFQGESNESEFHSAFTTREIFGSSESLFTRFDRGELTIRAIPGVALASGTMDCSLFIDDSDVVTEDLSYGDKITFIGDCSGKRIQLRCEFDTPGFALGKIEARIQTQDKRRLPESSALENYEAVLASDLCLWTGRVDVEVNACLTRRVGNEATGAYTVVVGPDGRQTAVELTA